MEEIIYFSVNNWFCGRDYPPTENFKKWLGDDLNQTFRNNEWAKENIIQLLLMFRLLNLLSYYQCHKKNKKKCIFRLVLNSEL